MSTIDGIIGQIIKSLPENERGSVSIDRCIDIARTAAIRYAEELEKKAARSSESNTSETSSYVRDLL